jgi:hypothetical protein
MDQEQIAAKFGICGVFRLNWKMFPRLRARLESLRRLLSPSEKLGRKYLKLYIKPQLIQ